MAWLHTWAGLVFGWILFAIFLTGTLSYFKDEINRWSHPEAPAQVVDARTALNSAQAYLQANAADASRWYISLPDARNAALSVMWQQEGKRGFVDKLVDPREGTELHTRDSRGGEFFYRFHYELQMGYPWGRWLATLSAFVMLVTLVSGIITHKKIFKDFFTFRPGKGQRSWLDGHNAIGVLLLPFFAMISYSSLVIFMTMVMPASILTTYDNDLNAFYKDVFPSAFNDVKAAGTVAPLQPLSVFYDKALEQWPGGHVGVVDVQHPGDANARVSVSQLAGDRIVHSAGNGLLFDGVSGALLKGRVADSLPVAVAGSFYGLHMGNFAGPVLRWVYFFCGIGGTLMIGTGLVMWLGKRQLKHAKTGAQPLGLRVVAVLNIASMAGLLLAVVAFFWANRLLPTALPDRAALEVKVFFLVWLLSAGHAVLRPGRRAWVEQLSVAAVLYAGLPVLNALTTGQGLQHSIPAGDWAMAGVDLTALGSGLFLLWSVRKLQRVNVAPVKKPRRTAVIVEGEVS